MEWFVYSTLTHGSDPKGDILVILSAVNLKGRLFSRW